MEELNQTIEKKPKNTPRDVFMHLLAIVTLYIGVISFIALFFQYINTWFPDQLEYYYSSSRLFDAARRAMAALIVVWPVYLLMMHFIARDTRANPAKRELGVRKWLVYLTLFIAAVTIIVDLITLINSFLGGELTSRFALKVLVVLVTASAVFGFYLWDLKSGQSGSVMPKRFAWAVSVVLLVSIVSGFLIVGTPAEQRQIRFDEQRVSDLQTIQGQIVYSFWQPRGILPESLGELGDSISGFMPPSDPESGQAYQYRITGDLSFELCANFTTASQNNSLEQREFRMAKPFPMPGAVFDNWSHEAGYFCFARAIDPKLYPVQKEINRTIEE